MIEKTKGIVIKQTRFNETGSIIGIYTFNNGLMSFFVRGIGKKGKRSNKAALFEPLTLLNLEIRYSGKNDLHHIIEADVDYAYQNIPQNMIKRSLLIFVNELLVRCLKEETRNAELFDWIHDSLIWLDLARDGYVNFHLLFMIQFSMFLGFYPNVNMTERFTFFDLENGKFLNQAPSHPNYVEGDIVAILHKLIMSKYEDSSKIVINKNLRNGVLNALIAFFDFHIPSLGKFKSVEILSVVLD